MARRFVIGFTALLGVLAAIYSGLWFFFAHNVWQAMEQWRDVIHWRQADLGGFPGPITLHWQGVRATMPSGIAWDAQSVTGKVSLFSPRTVHFSISGDQTLTLPQQTPQALRANRADFDLTIGSLPRMVLLLEEPTLNDFTLAKRIHLSLSALEPVPTTPDTPEHRIPHWSFILRSQDWQLPHPPAGFDPVIDNLALSGRIQGALDQGIIVWSQNGGTVEVERLSLAWQPITIDGGGTVALTPEGGLTAALSTSVTGIPAALDSLAQQKLMSQGAARAAKIPLSLMMRPNTAGKPALSIPLTVQDDRLTLGPVPSIPLPKWRLWGHNP